MSATTGATSIEIDETIWAQLRRLDLEALAQVHDRFYPPIERYVSFRLGDENQAREISAAVMGQLVEACGARRGPGRKLFGLLLSQAARRVEEALSRQARREARRSAGEANVEPAPTEIKEEIRLALRKLPPEQQHFLALRFACQLSLAEAAELLGRSLNEASELQWRALNQLRRGIAAE